MTRSPWRPSTCRPAGLALGTVGSAIDRTCDNIGTVMSQRPAAGSYVLRGTQVSITIGKYNPRLVFLIAAPLAYRDRTWLIT